MTAYRAAKEQITARVLADVATEQARQRAAQEREAQAEQARIPIREGAMATSTAHAAPGIETMSPVRIEAMDTAIATVQAQGAPMTAEAVHRLVGGTSRARAGLCQGLAASSRRQRPCPP